MKEDLKEIALLSDVDTTEKDGKLKLSDIKVNEDYLKKWNNDHTDFVVLSRNGEILRDTLYRIGGLNCPNPEKDEYISLIKYVEAYYNDDITKDKKRKPHLEGRWCIIDKYGTEKFVAKPYDSIYLVKDSVIYSIEGKYYNIETGEYYGSSLNSMQSSEYLFINNIYEKDKSKEGIMKINKKDGSYKVYK